MDGIHIAKTDAIARRYLVLNAFDGALTTLGIVAGAYFAGTIEVRGMVLAGLGAGVAMGISGAWGAYTTERAERSRSIRELERALFTDLSGSGIEHTSRAAVAVISFIDGLAPLLVSLLCLSPLLLTLAGVVPLSAGVYGTFGIDLGILFSLGIFLGKVSGANLLLHGFFMLLAGAAIFLFVLLVGGI